MDIDIFEPFVILSENLVGIDYKTLVHECEPIVQLVRLSEDLGLYHREFERMSQGSHEVPN